MKRILLVLIIAASLSACSNGFPKDDDVSIYTRSDRKPVSKGTWTAIVVVLAVACIFGPRLNPKREIKIS